MARVIRQYDPFMWDSGSTRGKVRSHLVVDTAKYGPTAVQQAIDGFREGTLEITKAEYDEAVEAKEKVLSKAAR